MPSTAAPVLCRSMLFMPATNRRAMEKSRALDVDIVIFDLEDAVHPDRKAEVREAAAAALQELDFEQRQVMVRINAVTLADAAEKKGGHQAATANASDGATDIQALAQLGALSRCDGIVIPKVEHPQQIRVITDALDAAGAGELPVWIMLETASGVLSAASLCAASSRLEGVLLGTADLSRELRLTLSASAPEATSAESGQLAITPRAGLLHALSHCVLAARAAGIAIVDGVFMNIRDEAGLRVEAEQGRALGFDGKSLIHPAQLAVTHDVFSPDPAEIADLQAMVAAWEQAQQSGEGICLYNNRLVESLHVEQAQQQLQLHARIAARAG